MTEEPPSVPGHPAASGFVDGVKDSYQHARDLYKIIKKHGPGVVILSQEVADAWLKEVEERCLNRLDDCARDKARHPLARGDDGEDHAAQLQPRRCYGILQENARTLCAEKA